MQRNIWHSVNDHAEVLVGQYVVPNFVSNSVAICIAENEYVLYSPGASLLAAWPNKEATLHIVMPNAYHHLGVEAWLRQFPESNLYASDKAIKQLRKKQALSDTLDIKGIEELSPILPENMTIAEPPGHRAGDVWLVKYTENNSALWITCDSFLNYDRLSNQPVARFMQKFLGAAPGLKMSQVVKWFIMDDRKHFKTWALERLKLDHPVVLIPSHGEVMHSDSLAKELSELIKQRL